ncbi:MAG: SDR family oxidoreductase, partial [Pseudomonadota bacterium]
MGQIARESTGDTEMSAGRLQGKLAVISGGASGIGAATARRFVEEGARVVLGDIQLQKAEQLASDLGPAARACRLDVTKAEDWEAIGAMSREWGQLTTVVNSAGVSVPGTIEDIDLDAFHHTMAINLDGVFLGCKFGVEAMKGVGRAAIINVASVLGVQAGALFPAYSASKGGVRLLSQSVALHCAERGYDLRVNCVLPGPIHTEMVEGYVDAGKKAGQSREEVLAGFASVTPIGRLGRPEEAANAIVFLASDESSFTSGASLAVDGAMLA